MLRWPCCGWRAYTWFMTAPDSAFQSYCLPVKTYPQISAGYCTDIVQEPVNTYPQISAGYCTDIVHEPVEDQELKAKSGALGKYIHALQRCRKFKDVAHAKRIYECIHGSALETHIIIGNQIVQVLVESGALADAEYVFGHLACRNVLSWTALISGHINCGQMYHAFSLYHKMVEDNVNPSSYTFVALLRACTKVRDLGKGKEFHVEALQKGFATDFHVASSLVHMYAKFGLLSQAREVFDKLLTRDVVLWNALITGYSEHGLGEEALQCYKQMQIENISSTLVTFLGSLKACRILGSVQKGLELHSAAAKKAFDKDAYIASALVDLYAKCGSLLDAENVFDGLALQNSVLWNTLLAGYAEHGHGNEILKRLEQMQSKGIFPDAVTFTYGLKACGIFSDVGKCHDMHTQILEKGLDKDFALGSTLLDTYGKCGFLPDAQKVFDKLPVRDVVSWTALMTGYAQHGPYHKTLESFDQMQLDKVLPNAVTLACALKACINADDLTRGKQIHREVIEDGYEVDLLVNNALVEMYVKHGLLLEARDIFDTVSNRDVVLWNTLLTGYAENGLNQEALNLLEDAELDAIFPDAATYASAVKACGNMKAIDKGQELNFKIVLLGYEADVLISSMLIDMYAKCKYLPEACNIFDKLSNRDAVAWNVMIVGLLEHGYSHEVLMYLEHMLHDNVMADSATFAAILKACSREGDIDKGQMLHIKVVLKGYEGDLCVGSSLVDLYAKCGLLPEASAVFKMIPMKDDVLWNALLTGYVDNGFDQEAFACYQTMLSQNHSPSVVTVICVLKACGSMGAIKRIQESHMEVIQKGFDKDLLMGNTLVDTYGKCGFFQEASRVFDTLSIKDIASWNAMIKGSGMNHKGGTAMHYLKCLLGTGIKPDATTFTCLLTSCSQASMVEEGQDLFEVMREEFGIVPAIDHCACMVDLLARSGCVYEAEKLMQILPRSPNTTTWTALLSASKTFQEMETGSRCFQQLLTLNAGGATHPQYS